MEYAKFVKQEIISVQGRGLRDGDLKVLAKELEKSAVLEGLWLNNNRISFADNRFTGALAANRTLKHLRLENNRIDAAGAAYLALALKTNHTLEVIGLRNNRIGDQGVKSVADALIFNKSLEHILLSNNGIGDEGAKNLADSFLSNRSLQMVSLTRNKIGDRGAKSLATCLLVNQSLRMVNLDMNAIGDSGAKILAGALKCNDNVHVLTLAMNPINDIAVTNSIKETLSDPNRIGSSPLDQLEMFHAKKDEEIGLLEADLFHESSENASLKEIIASQDAKIASLKADLDDPKKDEAIGLLEANLSQKSGEIASLEEKISSQDDKMALLKADLNDPMKLLQIKMKKQEEKIASLKAEKKKSLPINETIDLTDEREAKRPRTQQHVVISRAALRAQQQSAVRIKREKSAAEVALEGARQENAVARADLEDAHDLVQQVHLAQDVWQRRFDELAAMAAARQVDGFVIADIRNRSLASGN